MSVEISGSMFGLQVKQIKHFGGRIRILHEQLYIFPAGKVWRPTFWSQNVKIKSVVGFVYDLSPEDTAENISFRCFWNFPWKTIYFPSWKGLETKMLVPKFLKFKNHDITLGGDIFGRLIVRTSWTNSSKTNVKTNYAGPVFLLLASGPWIRCQQLYNVM